VIGVGSRVVATTLDTFRTCGDGRRECLVCWLAPADGAAVTEVVHPPHDSSAHHCQLDDQWVTRFFLDLEQRAMRTVAQVHTHPGRDVRLSHTDQLHAIAPSTGFVSIVVPSFAIGDSLTAGWGIWTVDGAGHWTSMREVIEWTA
jgi:proteasome lid subunit RPN8/RPN11